MILRRVIEHVKAQNWFAVALDFVIVVMGVFLGVQLGNWNEANANARLGREYAARLSADLSRDLASTSAQTGYYDEVLKAVMTADDLLRDADADPTALVISAYRASEIMFTAPAHATWDQIVSSGHLGLLPNDQIVKELSDYYSFNNLGDIYRILGDSEYRRAVRRIIPIEIQIAMRAGCSDKRDADENLLGFAEGCVLKADPSSISATAEALRNDPALAAALRYQYSDVASSRLNLVAVEATIARALATLDAPEKEIGK